MARKFEIPGFYRSGLVGAIKQGRRTYDLRKRDMAPSLLDLGRVRFKLARHFGFCFGVENAIEIAYRALAENPRKRVLLLSEMIHNPHVNADLLARGVKFILSPQGEELIPFETLGAEDIVIVPAFGTTVQLFDRLRSLGIEPLRYNATCPFVEKVWKRAAQLGAKGFTTIIHGKHTHEETRATFSHAVLGGPALVILDLAEARLLADFIRGKLDQSEFLRVFAGRFSEAFAPSRDLQRIGVVNQTTMLATETQAISELLKAAMLEKYGQEVLATHYADTRDTLCYATYENQEAVYELVASGGDLALVVGGYNSSNTSHLVEILEQHVPTYYVKDCAEIASLKLIRHLDLKNRRVVETSNWFPEGKSTVEILISAGASCPDSLVDQVIQRVSDLVGAGDALITEHEKLASLNSTLEQQFN